eukprot:TRINITY_DN2008_c0_g2_i1.p1 TRINITY_DN2008_c0_g2~~TRINITY_DN2008_c0_g2_i1.p1  ORF type:complete len:204 (-),score=35.65 TRINITY_DN2008_c0_g2_i1:244-855(-)
MSSGALSGYRFVDLSRKIVAIGRNFAEHAAELGNQTPTSPFFFLKPTSSFLPFERDGVSAPIVLPKRSNDIHHEVELGVVIGKKAKNVSSHDAFDYIAGYVVALDLTARDIQAAAKAKGLPWSEAKGYDTFTPISDFIDRSVIPNPHEVELYCKVDDVERQRGKTDQMIFKIPQLIEHVTSVMTLDVGDVLLTGNVLSRKLRF